MSNHTLATLTKAFNQDLTNYQSIPFWSWNNELEEAELVKQIEQMKSVGIGGFIMHARTGLKTEYLGEKWFSCVDACLKKAKELHMNAWLYDENGWPSGFVGGKLLENVNFRAQYLEYRICEAFDESAFCVYIKTENGYKRISKSIDGIGEYHCIDLCTSPANTDILNPDVVDAFLHATHEEYYKRFSESFGKELVGFFTDEPQYYRWGMPFSRIAMEPYAKRYGSDIRDGLIYLFLQDTDGYTFRTRYYRLLNELYTNNFYKKVYNWCSAHNCKLTGHSVDEIGLQSQMLGGAGVMPSYRYQHIPGVDCLGRDCPSELLGKQVGSVASQLGIHQVLTETFACGGHDTTPAELKSIAEAQYFNGVNLMCQHLFPYSIAAQGKYDHPPVFSHHGNWWEEFKLFNDYFTRLGYIIANTKESYDVLVIHPLRSIYLNHIPGKVPPACQKLEKSFADLLLDFRKKGICYQLADETILEEMGKIENGMLVIGNCRYDTIVVPEMMSIASSTVELLEQFEGKLHMVDTPTLIDGIPASVSLCSNISFQEIEQNSTIKFRSHEGLIGMTTRVGEIGKFIFIKNYSQTQSSSFEMEGVAEHYRALDLQTMTLQNISNQMTLDKCNSLILIKDDAAKSTKLSQKTENITAAFEVADITENYLVLDYASISYDGIAFEKTLPIQRVFEDLLRADYRGPLYVKHVFHTEDILPLRLLLEREAFDFVSLNGTKLTLHDYDFDINFVCADILDELKIGQNEIIYCLQYKQHEGVHFALFDPLATESMRNCLYYDTNIENIYLCGDFTLDENQVIHRRSEFPPLSSQICQNGYPFFMGSMTLQGNYFYDGCGGRTLSLDKGRFMVAQIWVNGKKREMVLDTKKDITDLLQSGNNEIKIVLRSSLRNLLGPHHCKDMPEPKMVGPFRFTMRGSWKGEIAKGYTDQYQSVPFGVDAIEMILIDSNI